MRIRSWLQRQWRQMALFAEDMDYDPHDELRRRIERLEHLAAQDCLDQKPGPGR